MDEVKKFEVKYEYDYTENIDPAKISEVVKNGFGFGTNITNSIGNKQTAILYYEKLQADNLLEKDTYSDRRSLKIEGESHTQVTSDVNKAFGLDINTLGFKNTLKAVTNNGMKNTDDYEYGIRIFLGKALGVNLKPVTDLTPYIQDKALHDIAGIAVNGKVEYPTDDRKKLKKLFDIYGTHIITKAIFGCRYQYYYMRESINQETEISTQVDCNLSGKFSSENGLGDLGVALGQGYDESYTSCRKDSNKKEYVQSIGGGNLSTFAEWEAGMDFLNPTTIALIGYIMPDTTNDPGLIPIWQIVSDSERVQKMQEAYDEYLKENITPVRKSKKVIIDVFGRHFDKKDNAPDSIKETDFRGVLRKYYKLDEEIMCHVKGSKKGTFYFYYAFAYSSAGGLSEIKFDNRKNGYSSPWITRGNHANEGVTGCLDDNVIWICPVEPNGQIDENNLISGFGVDVEGNRRTSEGASNCTNWATGGCDWYKGLVHDNVHCIYTKDKI